MTESPEKSLESAGEKSAAIAGRERVIEALKLAGVTVAWFLMTKYLVPLGDKFVPDELKAKISLQTFRMICQVVTLVAGVGLSFALLRAPRIALGLKAPRPLQLGGAALLAPAAFVASTYLALRIALPTLLAELATRGPGASRQNAGELGRTLTQAPLLVVILWGALLAAVGEEALFRGALWSTLRDAAGLAIDKLKPRALEASGGAPVSGEEVPAFVEPGPFAAISRDHVAASLATIGAAVIFGQMHADMPGGVGLVRVASTTILGLVCGASRQITGTIWVPILLHLANNTLTIGSSRRWFSGSAEPLLEGLPDSIVIAAVAGALVAGGAFAAQKRMARRTASSPVPSIEP